MAEKLFTAKEFIKRVKDINENYNNVYALGMYGFKITEKAINDKAKQLPSFYTDKMKTYLKSLIGKDYWGFDCVCMIKAILWGWNGADKPKGGAVRASNNVPDFGADSIGNYCDGFTDDFSNIEPGEVLWMPGHVGVYIGDGLGIECTIKWEGKVQCTAVGNIGFKKGYYTRCWNKHGKLKWIDYDKEDEEMTDAEKEEVKKLSEKVDANTKAIADLANAIRGLAKTNTVYRYYTELPKYARPVIEAMHKDGIFAGAGPDNMDLPYSMMRTLVILAGRGVFGKKYKKLVPGNIDEE